MSLDPTAWTDISSEGVRTYHYADGYKFQVSEPSLINIQPSSLGGHAHRIQTLSGEGVFIAPGWRAVSWTMKKDQTTIFTF